MSTHEKKEEDPFLKSLAALKSILTAQASQSPRHSNVRAPSPETAELRLEVQRERQQRQSLEKALDSLIEAKNIVQEQLDANKKRLQEKKQACDTLQAQLTAQKAQHVTEMDTEQQKVKDAQQKRQQSQEAVNAAQAKVARWETRVKELLGELQQKDNLIKQENQKHRENIKTQQKSVDVLLVELEKVWWKVDYHNIRMWYHGETLNLTIDFKRQVSAKRKEHEEQVAKEMAVSRKEVEGTTLASVEQDTEEAVDASSRKRPAESVMGDDKEESADKKLKH